MEEDEIERVAFTARLDLGESEKEEMGEDVESILDWFSQIDEVETEDVEPAFHPIDLKDELREDEAEETLSRDEVFGNTDLEEDGYFRGPSIV